MASLHGRRCGWGLLWGALAACGDQIAGGDLAAVPDGVAEAVSDAMEVAASTAVEVGPAGGSLDLPGGGHLLIPAGALPANTAITVTLIAPPAWGPFEPLGVGYRLEPEGLVLAVGAELVLSLAGRTAAQLATAEIFSRPVDGAWGAVPTDVDAAAGTLSAQLTHFSEWQPGQRRPCLAAAECEDGNPCSVESCGGDGFCVYQTAPGAECSQAAECDLGLSCQIPVCATAAGCLCGAMGAAAGSACDDENACTSLDHCNAQGDCQGLSGCDDGNPCTQDLCGPGGECQHPAQVGAECSQASDCDLGVACQIPVCAVANGCLCGAQGAPAGSTCDDGQACTLLDQCDAQGECKGQLACDDGNPCTEDACGPGGECQHPMAAGSECTQASDCDFGVACMIPLCTATCLCGGMGAPAGSACSDGSACTSSDQCNAQGECLGQPTVICPPSGDPCKMSSCNPVDGLCHEEQAALGAPCDDGDACTHEDACDAEGACDGEPVACEESTDPCQVLGCDPATGECSEVLEDAGTPCQDEDLCTTGDTCDGGGTCAGTPVDCETDGDPCTIDLCLSQTGACETVDVIPWGGECEDGDPCTQGETCGVLGGCSGGTPLGCPDDGKPCTVDACLPPTGCTYTPRAGGTPCDDANACTQADQCDAEGECHGDAEVACPDDGQPCTEESCDPWTGDCTTDAADEGASCDDGDLCTDADGCDGEGACAGLLAAHCDDGEPCTQDVCDAMDGLCETTPIATGGACDDDDECTAGTTCDAAGACAGGAPVSCDDGDPCTLDECLPGDGCLHDPASDGVACEDGDLCTTGDACAAGQCLGGAPLACGQTGDPCSVAVCDPADGQCYDDPKPWGTPCASGNLCMQEGGTCDGEGGCEEAPVSCGESGSPCVLNACDPTDGECSETSAGVGTPCDDGSPCTLQDQCDGGGQCAGTVIECPDDGDACTVEYCQDGECQTQGIPWGGECEDGDLCTQGETCGPLTGCSGGSPLACPDDGSDCTLESCDPATGCTYDLAAPGSACDDDDACTTVDGCDASGACQGSAPVDCPDGDDPCSEPQCDPSDGSCVEEAAPAGTPCDDGNPCSGGDACDGDWACTGTGNACDDGDPCTVDSCDPQNGLCDHVVQAWIPCDDEDPCTLWESCDETGQCGNGSPAWCEDGNPCTDDSCLAGAGCVVEVAAAGGACDDGDLCTAPDTCDGAGGCQGGSDPPCDDGLACTVDTCDAQTGCSHLPVPGEQCSCETTAHCPGYGAWMCDPAAPEKLVRYLCQENLCVRQEDACDDPILLATSNTHCVFDALYGGGNAYCGCTGDADCINQGVGYCKGQATRRWYCGEGSSCTQDPAYGACPADKFCAGQGQCVTQPCGPDGTCAPPDAKCEVEGQPGSEVSTYCSGTCLRNPWAAKGCGTDGTGACDDAVGCCVPDESCP